MHAPFRYRGFYDRPRMILVNYRDLLFLLDSPFDEVADEYPDTYHVYLLPLLAEVDFQGDWTRLPMRAVADLGTIPLSQVQFDKSRRATLDMEILERLGKSSGLWKD